MERQITEQENWSLVIRPQRAWWDLRLGEIAGYMGLVRLLIWRDFVAAYKQTVLGPFWYVIQQLMSTGVYTLFFGKVAQLSTDGAPEFLFYATGTTLWGYFSGCLTGTSNVFVGNARMFGKVYFPRLVMPISSVLSNLISFVVRLLVLVLIYVYFIFSGSDIAPNIWLLTFPLILASMAGLAMGSGLIISSLSVKYRDLQQLISQIVSMFMYATPVIYPLSMVPDKWKWVLLINPLTPLFEMFRYSLMGVSSVDPRSLLYSFGFTLVVLLAGVIIFNRAENNFMDTV